MRAPSDLCGLRGAICESLDEAYESHSNYDRHPRSTRGSCIGCLRGACLWIASLGVRRNPALESRSYFLQHPKNEGTQSRAVQKRAVLQQGHGITRSLRDMRNHLRRKPIAPEPVNGSPKRSQDRVLARHLLARLSHACTRAAQESVCSNAQCCANR